MSSPKRKNIPLHISVNQNYNHRRLIPEEGRWPSSPNVGMGCGGRGRRRAFLCARTKRCPRTAKSCGPGAAMLASSLWDISAGDGDNKPAHRGEYEVSRKAIAQGMSECLRSPVCSCAPLFALLAHETAGAACTRHSLRPLFVKRDNEFGKARAKRAAGTKTHVYPPDLLSIRHPEVHRKARTSG
jgi:hypothetical protein